MESKNKDVAIEPSWKNALVGEFAAGYFKQLADFVRSEYKTATVFPAPKNIFRAFEACSFDATRVVILGQDPYHGLGQANGLCFAVPENMDIPPSLQNIFKEIKSDLGVEPLASGDLTRWAKQGVLLLNATLTVRAHTAGSHQNKGWEQFTDVVIQKLSQEDRPIVFLLWGNYARKKGAQIDRSKHLVLESAHPSPLSAYNGFFGNKHFSKANAYLKKHGQKEIDWR